MILLTADPDGEINSTRNHHVKHFPVRRVRSARWFSYRFTNLISLPSNLTVEGNLDLSCLVNLLSLPDGLVVGKSLTLDRTPLTSLPTDLRVGERIILGGTLVAYIPPHLRSKVT